MIVVGGGNSASQAAVFLAETARRVHMVVRSVGLAEGMSRYLIRRIKENPAIILQTHTELTTLEGDNHLERVTLRNHQAATTETRDIRHIFVMAASQHTLARGLCRTRRERIYKDGTGSVAGRLGDRALAARPSSPSPGDEPARCVRSRWLYCYPDDAFAEY